VDALSPVAAMPVGHAGRPSVIKIENLSVAYNMYSKPSDMLKEVIFGGVRHDRFWALRDINLDVLEGQRIGIVGPNGAGKSTLLQTIAGRLTPTTGKVAVHGKISSLLSLVPVWNPEETGLENIRFNLLVQGIASSRIPVLSEEIIDFTELGSFIFHPVKTYSSGMSARLSFAIATAVDPEILIVDEVLGAGDAYFAAKAARRMKEFCARGKALLFVSHSTAAVRSMCDTCVWIENGQIRAQGPSEVVVRAYDEDCIKREEAVNRAGNKQRAEQLLNGVAPEDITPANILHLRVRPRDDLRLGDTHYIKDITVTVGGETHAISPEITDPKASEAVGVLDILSCEWGRYVERGVFKCRTLAPKAGARRGGHIVIDRDKCNSADGQIRLAFDTQSLLGTEKLTVDALDVEVGEWRQLDVTEETAIGDGWTRIAVEGRFASPDEESVEKLVHSAVERHLKPVEIVSVKAVNRSGPVSVIKEFDPFTIEVTLQHNEAMPSVNVNLDITRSDGFYAFFQASCFDAPIEGHKGSSRVSFDFEPNPFGAGIYEISVAATNAFTLETAPPDDVYDRAMSVLKLDIAMARPIMFGAVNVAVKTRVELSESGVLPSSDLS
jgi:ABC-type polysaccharide/polyol phosphate transport system ATPase subunit